MAPPGTKIVTHKKPTQRASWDYHGDDGFYIGPALEHYRCVQCLMTNSRRIRISDTVQFFPHPMPFPQMILNDRLLNTLDNIISTLNSPSFQQQNPTLQFDNQTLLAIQIIANMLHRLIPKPNLPHPRSVLLTKLVPVLHHPVPPPRVVMPTTTPTPLSSNNIHSPTIPKSKPHPHTILKMRAKHTATKH